MRTQGPAPVVRAGAATVRDGGPRSRVGAAPGAAPGHSQGVVATHIVDDEQTSAARSALKTYLVWKG